jgi:hypothetical protein
MAMAATSPLQTKEKPELLPKTAAHIFFKSEPYSEAQVSGHPGERGGSADPRMVELEIRFEGFDFYGAAEFAFEDGLQAQGVTGLGKNRKGLDREQPFRSRDFLCQTLFVLRADFNHIPGMLVRRDGAEEELPPQL